MRKYIPLILLIHILLAPNFVFGQQSKIDSFFTETPFLIKGSYQLGKVLPTNDFIRGDNLGKQIIEDYTSFSVLLLRQTTGAKLWEQLFGYPAYGIGFYTAFFDETTALGNPISVYGYFSGPFVRFHKLSFNYDLGLGLAFNWNDFNPVNNPDNISIGADRSVHMEAGVNLEYQLARRFSLSVGYGFNHFSNGKLKLPNMGLNTEAAKFSLVYQLNNPTFSFIKNEVPKFEKHNEWDFSFYAGAENVIYNGDDIDIQAKYKGLFFPVYGVINTFNRCIGYKSKIGAGFTAGYNGALNAQIAVENGELEEVDLPFGTHITLSVYPSYELVINRLSVFVQPGFYVYRKKTEESTTAFYQRLGVKYHFYKDYFLGVSLRATQFHVSNYIEWNIGRRINW